jgi:hypothetical protein|tara:strand:+ start:12804 stop:12908 length:105 start_codon:yes stop_codon:yes gene_type:complete
MNRIKVVTKEKGIKKVWLPEQYLKHIEIFEIMIR